MAWSDSRSCTHVSSYYVADLKASCCWGCGAIVPKAWDGDEQVYALVGMDLAKIHTSYTGATLLLCQRLEFTEIKFHAPDGTSGWVVKGPRRFIENLDKPGGYLYNSGFYLVETDVKVE